jgi:hypothetical protein
MTGPFTLPPVSRNQPPAFADAKGCREWLNHLPLANPTQAQSQLGTELDRLNHYALAAGERLRILELLRESVAFVQNECTKRFAARALPLASAEQVAFEANVSLWRGMCAGYQRCLEAALDGNADVLASIVQIVQRALWALIGEQLDAYRASYEVGAEFWRRLHGTFSAGEQLGAADQNVQDLLLDSRSTTAHAAYAYALLLHAASPFELSTRQLSLVQRWLARWSTKVNVSTVAPEDPKLPPLIVDVGGDAPGSRPPHADGNLRWLDVDRFAHNLRKRLAALHGGAPPASLGLGEECGQPECEALVRHVYERCCKGHVVRSQPRHVGSGPGELVAGFEAIYYFIAGKVFEQPSGAEDFSRRQRDEIALFGQRAQRFEDEYVRERGFRIERWQVLDESRDGMRFTRPMSEAGARITLGQLLAVQPPGTQGLRLAVVRWRTVAEGSLQIGVRLVAGAPEPASICATGLTSVVGPRCRPGFVLPAVDALGQPPSVIFPAAAFRPDRIVEIQSSFVEQVKLVRMLERGHDYERAEYRR